MSGIVIFDGAASLFEGLEVNPFPVLDPGVESFLKEADQPQGDVRLEVKCVPDRRGIEAIGLAVGEGRSAEGDESIGQRGFFAGHEPLCNEMGISPACGGKNLRVVELGFQFSEELGVLFHEFPFMGQDIEGAQKVGVDSRVDDEGVGAAHPDVKPLEHFAYLGEKLFVGRVSHGEEDS